MDFVLLIKPNETTSAENAIRALGGELSKPGKTSGSRQRISLRGRKAVLHKPHPEPTMKKGSVESARAFLKSAGATPEKEGCKC